MKLSKQILKEIKIEDVLPRLKSKPFLKAVQRETKYFIKFEDRKKFIDDINDTIEQDIKIGNSEDETQRLQQLLKRRKENLEKLFNENFQIIFNAATNFFTTFIQHFFVDNRGYFNDINSRYQPEILNWLLTIFIKGDEKVNFWKTQRWTAERQTLRRCGYQMGFHFFSYNLVPKAIETFYQIKDQGIQRILAKSDINQISTSHEMVRIVQDAIPAYEKFKEQKIQKDAAAGMNKIFENGEWEIFIPETKAAACLLGKGTEWCTAAPGLDFYEHYHSKENPLIVFVSKKDPQEKYQFSFGSEQFMDANDV